MTSAPARSATAPLRSSVAPTVALPIGETPMNSIVVAIVLAVYCAPQAPAPGQAASSMAVSSSAVILPDASSPTPSKTSWIVRSRPW